ncbi:MAG: nucleotidyltransferase domain-containing protein [Candidatus Aenigmarchaeota archaeon]|nr:nucleotidyltransferase domain-containing protein [Candidatus Aenigmarchaeota archaeon]
MRDMTKTEMLIVLKIAKTPERAFNSNNISKEVGITSMGALKIMKKLEKEGVFASKTAGKATFYSIGDSEYARDYVKFLLKNEAAHSPPYTKRWINEIRKLKSADAAVLFGSVLRKGKDANDVDVLVITDQGKLEKLKEEVAELNNINEKHIHVIYQSLDDLRNNIAKQDKVVLNALKGIAVFGEEKLIEAIS